MDANLVLQAKSGEHKVFPLPSSVTVIGRRHNCDLRIPLDAVSRRHCELSMQDSSILLRDLGSRNGTYLNGNRMDHEGRRLEPGDQIQIGPLTFFLQIDGLPAKIAESKPKKPETQVPKPQEDALEGLDDNDLDLGDLDGSGNLEDLDLGNP